MKIQNWTYSKLIGYVFPSILSVLFVSLYTIVDGLFISRYVGTDALAAVNIVYPIYNFAFGISIMFCVGGSVLVAISLGAKQFKTANNDFSLVNLTMFLISLVTTLAGLIYINPLLNGLGLTEQLMEYGKIYAQLLLISMPFLTLKIGFEYFLRVDHNATLSFIVTLSGGIINIVLDYLFVAVFNWGVTGAGLATLSGIVISSIIGLYYFIKYAKQLIYGELLAELLSKSLQQNVSERQLTDINYLLPIPLYKQKHRQRGFNQAQIIASSLAKQLQISLLLETVERHKQTKAQEGLSLQKRKKNLKDAFSITCNQQNKLSGSYIVLIDDVVTTGATVNSLCSVLLQAGVKRIDVWCVCRTALPTQKPN